MSEKYDGRYGGQDSRTQGDDPPNSRLFIVSNRNLSDSDFREAFSKFGEIEDIWVVKDRRTGDNKGVTYIKYARTLEAANALETMNGKSLPGCDRPIKVMIASSRNKGSQREENEDEKTNRLFVIVSKTMEEEELETYFGQFGDIEYVNIVRDRETRNNKGFAYIKYYKFSHAAKAFEECDRKYRAVFSEPRKPNMNRHSGGGNNNMQHRQQNDHQMERMPPRSSMNSSSMNSFNDSSFSNNDQCYRVMVIGSAYLTEDQLWKLFNIVPEMEYCDLRFEAVKRRTVGTVVYSSLQWASYAVEKLHGFEYPTGARLIVKADGTVPKMDGGSRSNQSMSNQSMSNQSMNSSTPRAHLSDNPNIRHLAETIAKATTIIQNAGFSTDLLPSSSRNSTPIHDSYDICSVPLPSPKPLASVDAETEARCFIVCTTPHQPALLRDVFSRFGNLIEVYMLANRNCGYAKYSSKESAAEAMRVLHGADVGGGRIKVLKAEDRNDSSRKRLRLDDQC